MQFPILYFDPPWHYNPRRNPRTGSGEPKDHNSPQDMTTRGFIPKALRFA